MRWFIDWSTGIWLRLALAFQIGGPVGSGKTVYVADPLRIKLTGFDETHAVSDVVFQDVRVNGRPLTRADLKANAFVRNASVSP